ncbi:hypothetical protein KKF97_04530, partial [Myxococcota bacterium]|nr:hypothetical protein [Myxococcota bacterium]
VAPKAGLSPIDQLPESDDIMLAIVYEVSAASRETPSSRPEAATRLRDASGNNHLDVVGMYSVGDITKLKSIGFRH